MENDDIDVTNLIGSNVHSEHFYPIKRGNKFKFVRKLRPSVAKRVEVKRNIEPKKYTLSEIVQDRLIRWAEDNNAFIKIDDYYITIIRKMVLNVHSKNTNNVFMPREEVNMYEYNLMIMIELPHNKLDEVMNNYVPFEFKDFCQPYLVSSDEQLFWIIENMGKGKPV
jgi:hypothetical protein